MGKKQNYDVRKVRAKKELRAHLENKSGPAVVCCGPALDAHWITVLGMHNQSVYWIDYHGIFLAPLEELLSMTSYRASGVHPLGVPFNDAIFAGGDALLVFADGQKPPVKKQRH